MRPHIRAALDAAVDIDGEFHAQLFGNRLRLEHHVPRHLARARIGAEHIQRRMGQRGDRVEGQVAPELDPDLIAELGPHRRLQAPPRRAPWTAPMRALRFRPVGSPRENRLPSICFTTPGFDHLRRRVDHAAQHPVRPEPVPLRIAGIDLASRVPSSGPPILWKYHQGTPFTPDTMVVFSGPISGCIWGTTRRHGMRLERDDHIILRPEIRGLVRGGDGHGRLAILLDQPQAVFAFIAARCGPRATRLTSAPACASFAPI